MKSFIFLLAFVLVGCGTIKETTTTTTEPIKIPAVIIHDTSYKYIEWKKEGYAFVNLDSMKTWTLENLCRGEVEIDTEGIKAKVSYRWNRVVKTLADSLSQKNEMIETLQSIIVQKEKEIEATKTVKTTESTPGQLWIFWNSKQYWISSGILCVILTILVMVIVQMKYKLITKYIP